MARLPASLVSVRTCLLLFILFSPFSVSAQPASVPIDSLYARAERAAEAGSTDTALRLYGDILRRDSSQTRAVRHRADLYAEQKQYGKAAKELRRTKQLDSTPPADILGNRAWYLILAKKKLGTAQQLSR